MKTENNSDNMQRFRALYYGQKVLMQPNYTKPSWLWTESMKHVSDGYFLSLRSISSLTDGEKKECVRLISIGSPTIDYLRSIGILIPWMDLSIEDINAYGWVAEMENF